MAKSKVTIKKWREGVGRIKDPNGGVDTWDAGSYGYVTVEGTAWLVDEDLILFVVKDGTYYRVYEPKTGLPIGEAKKTVKGLKVHVEEYVGRRGGWQTVRDLIIMTLGGDILPPSGLYARLLGRYMRRRDISEGEARKQTGTWTLDDWINRGYLQCA